LDLFPKLKIKLNGRNFETVSDIQRESQTVFDSIKGNDVHGVLKSGKNDGIAVYFPNEIIEMRRQPKLSKLSQNFFFTWSWKFPIGLRTFMKGQSRSEPLGIRVSCRRMSIPLKTCGASQSLCDKREGHEKCIYIYLWSRNLRLGERFREEVRVTLQWILEIKYTKFN
jgi:hypothetical protein